MELILFSIVIFVALRYLYWRRKYYRYKNQKIKKNKQHNLTFQSEWETNKEKGDKYELQFLRYYKKQGYKVYPQGFIKGKADGGLGVQTGKVGAFTNLYGRLCGVCREKPQDIC